MPLLHLKAVAESLAYIHGDKSTKSRSQKKRSQQRRLEKKWCGREDSNLHGIATASPSSWCVCQFRHCRTGVTKFILAARLAARNQFEFAPSYFFCGAGCAGACCWGAWVAGVCVAGAGVAGAGVVTAGFEAGFVVL